jgi:predicted membrane metal-binding protein
MFIVIFNLFLFLAVICIILYGLSQWPRILGDSDELYPGKLPVEGSGWHLPVWVFLMGIFVITLVSFFSGN